MEAPLELPDCIKGNSNGMVWEFECLVSWMRQCRGQNIPMGGSLLKEKAKAFTKKLGIEFSASEDGLQILRKGMGLSSKNVGKAQVLTLTFVLSGRTRFRI
ncbi:hypothetical protein TNCV_4715581 [Trichonephila clavipes]|nr:hypothetical protein TNCV_4715581 [Trichonephila clavipes]